MRALVLLFCLVACSCVSSLLPYNLQHAVVDPKSGLSRAEIEQIIDTVTRKSHRMIFALTRSPAERSRPGEVYVYAVAEPDQGGQMMYILRKFEDGQWHITSYGPGGAVVFNG